MEAELVRIAILGIIAAIFVVIISDKNPELGIMLGLIFGVIALMIAFGKAGTIIKALEDTISSSGIDAKLLVPVLKITGMAYITQFSVDVCKDVGQKAIASKIETVGKIMMLVVAVPVVTSLIHIISSII
ncbi:MAG TPA: stage III sporulation protein AD [Clostridiaceae bacterium]|jgi:stage III sporulation protein AD|nr:stage III sporulation protein AD [Clostridiaceae bacterium]